MSAARPTESEREQDLLPVQGHMAAAAAYLRSISVTNSRIYLYIGQNQVSERERGHDINRLIADLRKNAKIEKGHEIF